MKRIIYILIILASILFSGCQQEIVVRLLDSKENEVIEPRTGILINDFSSSLSEIILQIPKEEMILDVRITNENWVEITTCDKNSHSGGVGHSYVFKKINNKWLQTQRGDWVS